MVFVGIDVAKGKHDCFILSLKGEVLADVFPNVNSRGGFETLLQHICYYASSTGKINEGLEVLMRARRSTGHVICDSSFQRNAIRLLLGAVLLCIHYEKTRRGQV